MRNVKQIHSAGPEARAPEGTVTSGHWPEEDADADDGVDHPVVVRRACPTCAQPVAVTPAETELPEHAVCSTPWNPFGLTVCPGSGRPVPGAVPVMEPVAVRGEEPLTLPETLDWRTQPFSHAGRHAARATEPAPAAAPLDAVRQAA
ncbi:MULTISPECIES: hypothetical protein [Streptomyces]|uniref:hypothetical protein n=1 Tax=Streptomyces TaxID=1883 RepID=UPI000CD4A15C|nr:MULTISPECIES: hypothetical protein [Streptomyces]